MNILDISATTKGKGSPIALVKSFEAAARAANATSLEIYGYSIRNKGFFSPRIANRFGFEFERLSGDEVRLIKILMQK